MAGVHERRDHETPPHVPPPPKLLTRLMRGEA
jgi:hypothetical protein